MMVGAGGRTSSSVLLAASLLACSIWEAHTFVASPMMFKRAQRVSRTPLRLDMRYRKNHMLTPQELATYQDGIEKVRLANKELHPHFENVREQEFFRYYAVDLLSSCTYFPTVPNPPPRCASHEHAPCPSPRAALCLFLSCPPSASTSA